MNRSSASSTVIPALLAAAGLFLTGCETTGPVSMVPPAAKTEAPSYSEDSSRPGLGTKAGSDYYDQVNRTQFYRRSGSPDAVASFYYNDEAGAKAMADLLGGGTRRTGMMELAGGRLRAGLARSWEDTFPYLDARTRQIVMGQPGETYQIKLENRTNHRQEVIVSVDSLNVLTGQVAGYDQRGYVIEPKKSITLDGFRVNDQKGRRFEFGSVAASKAAKNDQARNVGVIGLAIFEEDEAKARMMLRKEQIKRDDANAFPVGR